MPETTYTVTFHYGPTGQTLTWHGQSPQSIAGFLHALDTPQSVIVLPDNNDRLVHMLPTHAIHNITYTPETTGPIHWTPAHLTNHPNPILIAQPQTDPDTPK